MMKKKILLSASLFHALTDAATVITPMIFPILYSRKFLITSYSQIGLLSNLGLLITFVIQFLVVRLSFRHEYRTMMFVSGLGTCAAMALVPFARSFVVLVLFFMLIRIFTSFYHPIVIAWVSKSRAGSGKDLDDAMGIQSGSGNVGVFLAFLTVGFLAQRWNWKLPLLVWSLFGLILGTFGLLALRGVSSRSAERPVLHAAAWVRSLREIKRYIPGFCFGGMGWSVTIFYAPSLLNHKFQIPMGQTGLYLALWIGLGTITGYGYGVWSRRFGRKNVFLLSLGGAVISLFLIGFAPHKALAVAGLLAFGGFLLMTYPSLHTFVGSTVRPAGQTMAFSWVSNIQLLSGALVTLVSGFVSDRIGIQFPFILTGILTLAVFLFYVPRGPEFFGGTQENPPGIDVAPDAV
jgi:MFS family permease